MSTSPANICATTDSHSRHDRPTGFVMPRDEAARRAIRAIEENRLADADRIVQRMSPGDDDTHDSGWPFLIAGLLAAARSDFAGAEPHFWQAATWALLACGNGQHDPANTRRLAARALEKIGQMRRRRESAHEAEPIHRHALQLREAHGSFEELWETTMSLGHVAELARRTADAQDLFERAVALAKQCTENPLRKQAHTWSAVGAALLDASRYAEALNAREKAHEAWRSDDAGCLDTARASAKLAHALLKRGESIHDHNPTESARFLEQAIARLTETNETLLAFGPDAAHDAHWTTEQLDFAQRLRAALP